MNMLFSGLNNPTLFTNNGLCTAPRLGYEVSSSILALTGSNEDLVKILLKGLEVVYALFVIFSLKHLFTLPFSLILHPIVAGLVLLCLTGAILSFSHLFAICALVWTIIAAILASVSTAADLAIVIFAQKEIKKVSGIFFEILWGNAPWMSLAAVALLWIVLVIQSATLCGCCGVSKRLWTRSVRMSIVIRTVLTTHLSELPTMRANITKRT